MVINEVLNEIICDFLILHYEICESTVQGNFGHALKCKSETV